MVLISEIRTVRSFCCIVLDNGEQYWLRRNDLACTEFREGSSFEPETFKEQIRLLQYPRALNHAVSMLARRPCSKKEIMNRLIRLRYSEDTAELVLYKLEKEHLVDDAEFCEQWIRFRLARHTGSAVIRRELKIRGIPEEMISSALDRLDPEDEQCNAVSLALKMMKRYCSEPDNLKRRRKVIESLVRKGYDWDTARAACETAEQETE